MNVDDRNEMNDGNGGNDRGSTSPRRLRVAMIGSRGIPAQYGGVETVVAVLARALVARGHEVTVFCRRGDYGERPTYVDGVRCVYLWAPEATGLAAIIHATLATAWVLPRRFDVVHYHALGPGLLAFVPRLLTRARVVQTVHGRDDRRAKWGRFPKLVLGLGARSSARVPHATLVVSHALEREYLSEFGRVTSFVPNATGPTPVPDGFGALAQWGLEIDRYVVSIGRIVPEKAPHELVQAFVESDIDAKLVLVGGWAGTDDYAAEVRATAGDDPRVVVAGAVYGPALTELLHGAAVFVTASHLEGLPTSLIEAGRSGTPCLASDLAPHTEILGRSAPGRRTFPVGDLERLRSALAAMLDDLEAEKLGAAALADDLEVRFSIERAVHAHEVAYGVPTSELDLSDDLDLTDGFALDGRTEGVLGRDRGRHHLGPDSGDERHDVVLDRAVDLTGHERPARRPAPEAGGAEHGRHDRSGPGRRSRPRTH